MGGTRHIYFDDGLHGLGFGTGAAVVDNVHRSSVLSIPTFGSCEGDPPGLIGIAGSDIALTVAICDEVGILRLYFQDSGFHIAFILNGENHRSEVVGRLIFRNGRYS